MVVATNTGEFMGRAGHPAAGHRSGLDAFRIHNGKIVEMWVAQDRLALLRELGVFP